MFEIIQKIKRGFKKPLPVILERIGYEIRSEFDRFWEPYYPSILTKSSLLSKLQASNLDILWAKLSKIPYPATLNPISLENYEQITQKSPNWIFEAAEKALNHDVNLLGSGPIDLGSKIKWNKDYKTDILWENKYFRSISYSNLDKPSDVKFPWELSRMQWMVPLGQAYLLTQDEKYAEKVKSLLTDWISDNPFAKSVNWTCTMEVALRIVTWTWFFHIFSESNAWKDNSFREIFIKNLYLHAFFTERHLEKSDINGNHYTADATGLVFAGLFFGSSRISQRWQNLGWKILKEEIALQVFEDGVDYEASVPYHRLVQELFFFPALYRHQCGFDVSDFYKNRLKNMAIFTACYTRQDGGVPLWGDADDARTLPFGSQGINDHRYLLGLIGIYLKDQKLLNYFSGSNEEIFWVYGDKEENKLKTCLYAQQLPISTAFREGGFYIMRHQDSHVFIDCGPLGLKGRGGHGHNDILSFEAALCGVPLIVDCGAYLYTANYKERNNFRSTSYHNTPQIDGIEINRFIREDYLWNLHEDAQPIVYNWNCCEQYDLFEGSHTGYLKIDPSIELKRKILLDKKDFSVEIEDQFNAKNSYAVTIPFHFHPDVIISQISENEFSLKNGKKKISLIANLSSNGSVSIESARISPSYGIIKPTKKLVWSFEKSQSSFLKIKLTPLF